MPSKMFQPGTRVIVVDILSFLEGEKKPETGTVVAVARGCRAVLMDDKRKFSWEYPIEVCEVSELLLDTPEAWQVLEDYSRRGRAFRAQYKEAGGAIEQAGKDLKTRIRELQKGR